MLSLIHIYNTELYYTEDPTQLTYTMEVAEYNRIGTTANYIMTYRFLRQTTVTNKDGKQEIKGVPRLVEPQLRLVYNGGLYNFFTLGTSDEVTFTIYPNGNTISTAAATMVDFYQASILTNAAVKANGGVPLSDSNGTSATDKNGFRFKGTLSLVNEELATNSTEFLTLAILKGGLNLPVTKQDLADAQTNLRKAWVTLNSNGDGTLKPAAQQKGLTFDQMNYAIANDGALQP